jgi:hypothetical protein
MRRIAKLSLVPAVATFVAFIAAAPLAAQRPTEFRTVRGTVVDKSDASAGSAVVYLKNSRTLSVKTYIAEGDGEYHFTGLDPNADYEIHAERGPEASGNHTVSSLDSRKEFVVSLKLDRGKK